MSSALTQPQGAVRGQQNRPHDEQHSPASGYGPLFGRAFIGLAVLTGEGEFRSANPAFCTFVGHTEVELTRLTLLDLVPHEQRGIVAAMLICPPQAARQQNFLNRQGEPIWALIKFTLAETGTLLQVQDISAFKRVRHELEQSQRMLATLMSNLPGMAYRCGLDDRRSMEFVSDGSKELSGYTPAELTDAAEPKFSYGRLIHPEDREAAWQQLSQALAERRPFQLIYRLLGADGEERWVKEQGRGVFDKDGRPQAIEGLVTDVTKSQRLACRLAHQAAHDDLTGLVNRREFETRVSKALEHTKRFNMPHALCYLDLDQFKIINDTVGHRAGDELLKQVAGLLGSKIRGRDTLARLGGDEFGLLLENCPLDKARELADTLVTELREFRFLWDSRIFQIGVSIGLVPISADAGSIEQLLSRADVACYTAKDLGRNRVYVYQAEDADLVRRHSELERVASLRDALENDRLRLYRQPILPLSADTRAPELGHCEVLLRLADQDDKLLLPGAFIPAAERYGLMESVDRWVIHTVLSRFDELFERQSGLIAINLSGNSLTNESLLEFVKNELAAARHKLAPEQLCFEITETAAISNLGQATRFIAEMKRLGCRFALDDFGSGLSSFAYLKYFPVDYLKIDGSFVRDMVEDKTDHAMVAAINQIGHVMGIRTIAEYAETDAVVASLRTLAVDFVQGYAVGPPTPMPRLDGKG